MKSQMRRQSGRFREVLNADRASVLCRRSMPPSWDIDTFPQPGKLPDPWHSEFWGAHLIESLAGRLNSSLLLSKGQAAVSSNLLLIMRLVLLVTRDFFFFNYTTQLILDWMLFFLVNIAITTLSCRCLVEQFAMKHALLSLCTQMGLNLFGSKKKMMPTFFVCGLHPWGPFLPPWFFSAWGQLHFCSYVKYQCCCDWIW